jgi:O-methyltransferase involved in polyketide biosynthesis
MRDSPGGNVSTQDFSPDNDWTDPFDIDTTVAHPARRYNYWLGGTDNFEADRISGDAYVAAFPKTKIAMRENRSFLRRAVTYLVKEAGIRQFLDMGTGIPTAGNVHEVAQSLAPESRVVYVDNDPVVLAHAQRLLTTSEAGATTYIHADLRDPDAIFGNADLQRTLDLSRPVALMLIAVAHFLTDDEVYGRVTALTDRLPPGSYLAMSHTTKDFLSAETIAKVESARHRENARSRDPAQFRSRREFARFFDGMTLVPPGVKSISEWHNDDPPDQRTFPADTLAYGAVARIS